MAHKITEKEETDQFIVISPALCINKPIIKSFKSVRLSNPLSEDTSNSTQIESSVVSVKREVTRCLCCRRKVGLTGFRCRCGDLFCSEHRYSDRHDCSYDYKGVGREMIARENPVVKAAKIIRI